ncbi:MAG: hypothetical protein AUJ34_03490 [Parcubacteria group bacterium CG1_02_41_12]|nr:MAG: hypothetical protein AUJ34_03490 [Parcubacteria group bacterium CG1_02_41_12]
MFIVNVLRAWYNIHMPEEEQKKQSIWKFYFQARWQTVLSVHFLVAAMYLILFYIGNIFVAFKFAFFSIITSARLLGLEFALWAVIFELTVIVPFFTAWYAVLLLPNIWRTKYGKAQKVFLTIVMLGLIPIIIIITDGIARFALETEVLREFAVFHSIEL